MLNTATMLKDSLLALGVLALGSGLFGGLAWAGSTLAGGTIVLLSLWFTQAVAAKALKKHLENGGGGALIAVGLLVKGVVGVAMLIGLLQVLPAVPLMLGILSVVSAIAVRNAVMMFSSPNGAQEA
ncbi:MAG: hypothetical protein GY913_07930 [Proteobacteria bacterium]|nr:hypothetical protein [Pseudomonadota bacterium]MCP4916841.1 hypothetical protein [Pseudomonadota bacterium]